MHSDNFFFFFFFNFKDIPPCIIILITEWQVVVDASTMEINNIINSF